MVNQQSHAGVFITFEGGDGSGKTTHINFLARALRAQGREVVCLREPGGTQVGEALRDIVLNPANTTLCDRTELLLYEAARAQLVDEVIKPALEQGAIVLCDRFFDSTTAYQAYGRGLPRDFVEQANLFAADGTLPDRTVLIDTMADASVGLSRALRDRDGDRMERAGLEFHERVATAFADLVEREPERVRVVPCQPTKSGTAHLVFEAVADVCGWDRDNLPFDEEFFAEADEIHGDTKATGGE